MPDTLPLTGTARTAHRIGRNVAAELTRHRVAQADAATEVGLSRTAFVARLNGRHGGLTAVHLDALALMLGINVEAFYVGPARRTPDTDSPVDREAGQIGVTVLAVTVVVGLLMWAAIPAYGHLILWLAGIDNPGLVAALLVGIACLGFPAYAACVIAQDLYTRAGARRRRARTLAGIAAMRVSLRPTRH